MKKQTQREARAELLTSYFSMRAGENTHLVSERVGRFCIDLPSHAIYLFRRFVSVSEKPAAAVSTLSGCKEEVSEDKFLLNIQLSDYFRKQV